LLDIELLNEITQENPDITFVLIGQVLDWRVFSQIEKRSNFHYLGDKHYRDYPAYVAAFDVCAIPYVVGEGEHGGDSIKFYEYLAANKPVVTTGIEGISGDLGVVHIANSATEFSKAINASLASGPIETNLPERLTWKYKTDHIVSQLLKPTEE